MRVGQFASVENKAVFRHEGSSPAIRRIYVQPQLLFAAHSGEGAYRVNGRRRSRACRADHAERQPPVAPIFV